MNFNQFELCSKWGLQSVAVNNKIEARVSSQLLHSHPTLFRNVQKIRLSVFVLCFEQFQYNLQCEQLHQCTSVLVFLRLKLSAQLHLRLKTLKFSEIYGLDPIFKKFQKIPYIFLSIWHFIGTPQKKSFKEIISNFT